MLGRRRVQRANIKSAYRVCWDIMTHSLNSGLLLPASVHGVTLTVTVETTPASSRRQFIIPDLH